MPLPVDRRSFGFERERIQTRAAGLNDGFLGAPSEKHIGLTVNFIQSRNILKFSNGEKGRPDLLRHDLLIFDIDPDGAKLCRESDSNGATSLLKPTNMGYAACCANRPRGRSILKNRQYSSFDAKQ
jgi:hypothetical protein